MYLVSATALIQVFLALIFFLGVSSRLREVGSNHEPQVTRIYTENSDDSLPLCISVHPTVYSLCLNLYLAFQERFLHLLAVQAES